MSGEEGRAPLRVCVDARLVSGDFGGVEQVAIGLAAGLSSLTDGDEEYLFLTFADHTDWLRPYLRGPCRLLPGPPAPRSPAWKERVKAIAPFSRDLWHRVDGLLGRAGITVPRSDGTVERAGADVVHFTHQGAFLTDVPSIYHPHDLQHVHLPQFFSRRTRLVRDVTYRAFCHHARMVAVTTSWCKQDVIHHFGLPPENVAVIPLAPVLDAYPTPGEGDLAAARRKLSLPEAFILYPAQTWPHKNHLGLLEALALLKRDGCTVPLVATGRTNDFYPKIRRRARELGIEGQVQFPGFVSPLDLQCLYRLCRAVVIPTKFEADSGPLWEAFLAGAPAACSNVTALPRQAGDAALVFDPDRPDQIAAAVRSLWTDAALRRELAERGQKRVAPLTWDRTARTFRAHYRRVAGRPLPDEDRALIAEPPLL